MGKEQIIHKHKKSQKISIILGCFSLVVLSICLVSITVLFNSILAHMDGIAQFYSNQKTTTVSESKMKRYVIEVTKLNRSLVKEIYSMVLLMGITVLVMIEVWCVAGFIADRKYIKMLNELDEIKQ